MGQLDELTCCLQPPMKVERISTNASALCTDFLQVITSSAIISLLHGQFSQSTSQKKSLLVSKTAICTPFFAIVMAALHQAQKNSLTSHHSFICKIASYPNFKLSSTEFQRVLFTLPRSPSLSCTFNLWIHFRAHYCVIL